MQNDDASQLSNGPAGDSTAGLRIAHVGSYPPRQCGIATFTRDVVNAIGSAGGGQPVVVAMTDTSGAYIYPEPVRCEIRQGVKDDYTRAADYLNYSNVDVVSVQHEFGIYGGDDGAHLLGLLSRLRKPVIATFHTVLREPSDSQRRIVRQLADRCGRLVVMSHLASDLLEQSHDVPRDRVAMIPHGIPDLPTGQQEACKARFGMQDRRMLLTFGLLSPNKGIEVAIRALPRLVERFPDLVYFVVGATHPHVKRQYGEEYRTHLAHEAETLGVADHVVFRNEFVSSEELAAFLQAADIYVTPYINEAQITSGALAYAMGAGTAVVSTPYWHAQELLADGRGRMFPFGDSDALAHAVEMLLANPDELKRVREEAWRYTRPMTWPQVGRSYLRLADQVRGEAPPPTVEPKPLRELMLPELRLDHLLRLTDDTGMIQHATWSVPARETGYCVDDNARALIVALLAHRVHGTPETDRLITTYLGFLHHAQTGQGHFYNLMTYDRRMETDLDSEDCVGRALWALGMCMQLAPERGLRRLACEMFERTMRLPVQFNVRGQALSILGLEAYLQKEPGRSEAREMLVRLADDLVRRYDDTSRDEWRWFEPVLTYDNAMIPLGLFKAHAVTGSQRYHVVARESLAFLESVCFSDDHLHVVGNEKWYRHGGERSAWDEQPIDAAAFVLAFRAAYMATSDGHYLRRMRESFEWFLGRNRLQTPLYDFATAGCRDGLGNEEVSENQGAESTLSFLLALLAMLDVGDRGAEVDDADTGTAVTTVVEVRPLGDKAGV